MPDINKHSADEFLEEFRKDSGNAPLALYTGAALHRAGRLDEAAAVWTIGHDESGVLRHLHKMPEIQGDLREFSLLADKSIAEHFTGMHRETVMRVAAETGADLSRVLAGVWPHFATEPFRYRADGQRPDTFYMPDLEAKPVWPGGEFAWAAALQDAAETIRSEYLAAAGLEHVPCIAPNAQDVKWARLSGSDDWAAINLYFNAARQPEAEHFPATFATLTSTPLLTRDDVPLEVMFSRMRPDVEIPPHCGLTNTRLTVHLPIIAPEGSAFRIASNRFDWGLDAPIIIDDSFLYEAWNGSDEDFVALTFKIPHPHLAAAELMAIEAVYDRFDSWVADRIDRLGIIHPDAPTKS
ncbi:MAG: hypothetical protein GC152_01975 [Alphaproteobacteria bacterium]|nr:hypothetical protein [Alphaproteobacteria bacterium]